MFIFDQYDAYFRYPGGALKAAEPLRLRLKVERGEAVNVQAVCRLDGGEAISTPMRVTGLAGVYDVYTCEIAKDMPGLYWYHFQVNLRDGSTCILPEHPGGAFQISVYDPAAKTPDWIQGGLIYHIFVDRFKRGEGEHEKIPPRGGILREDWGGTPHFLPDEEGIVHNNDFFGGDFYGIIEKLPYLEELGVTCIYLSPVFEAASNHKYDTGDFLKMDPAFGGDEAFAALSEAAKARGIRIILDGVFNHVGVDSRYFNRYGTYEEQGAYQSKDSPYFDWFSFQDWPDVYEAWWGISLLPAINEQKESYRDFICGENGVIAHWAKRGVSGWRLDVVDELPDVFLDPLCAAMKREDKDALIIGEVWEDASNKVAYGSRRRYFQGGQLDSVTNYPLKNAIIAFVKEGDAPSLAAVMDGLYQNYPKHVLNALMNILGTHDTMRILTVLGGAHFPHTKTEMEAFRLSNAEREKAKARLKIASALQFTLPGVPCVYYGDEAGMEGGADPFCRACYPWGGEDHDLLDWYKELSRVRQKESALKDGTYTLRCAREGVFAFTRGAGRGQIFVVANASNQPIIIEEENFNFDLLQNRQVERLEINAGEAKIFSIRTTKGT